MRGLDVADLDCGAARCKCDCHRNPDMGHAMTCCQVCPKCGVNVQFVCDAAVYQRVLEGPRYPRPNEEPN